MKINLSITTLKPLQATLLAVILSELVYTVIFLFFLNDAGYWIGFTLSFFIPVVTAYPIHYILYKQAKKLEASRKQIARQNKKLEQVLQQRKVLLSIISHDLRSPVDSFYQLLQAFYEDLDHDPEAQDLMKFLIGRTENIKLLINNLLAWASEQENSQPDEIETFSLYSLVEEVSVEMEELLVKKHLILVNCCEESIMIRANPTTSRIVLRNLISNSIKFSYRQSTIEISAKLPENGLQFVKVAVKDQGVGMQEQVKVKLFNLNERYTSLGTANEQGNGLGLFFCKEFINQQGGEIWVESQEKQGSTFYFTLPITRAV
ncbi:HAMP domain-containing sensor histidine kinase [Rapidithrix thailandica]|uniref:histidine kinase n=1 Tax=Rapidithrix thailandica TaxID=413964 RepID=A0AAW9SHT2_9BACT